MKALSRCVPFLLVFLRVAEAEPKKVLPVEMYGYEIFFPANQPGLNEYKRPGHFFPHPVASTTPKTNPPRVSLTLPNATLSVILEELVRQTEVPIAMATPLLPTRTTLNVQDVLLGDAVRELALKHQLRFVHYGEARVRFFFPRVRNALSRSENGHSSLLVLAFVLSFAGFSLLMDLLYTHLRQATRNKARSRW